MLKRKQGQQIHRVKLGHVPRHVPAQPPRADSWWAKPMTWEEFQAMAQAEAPRIVLHGGGSGKAKGIA